MTRLADRHPWVLAAVAWTLLAAAPRTWRAEGPPAPSRSEAEALLAPLEGELTPEPMVLRRFIRGEGWVWLVRSPDLDTEEEARAWARVLVEQGIPTTVVASSPPPMRASPTPPPIPPSPTVKRGQAEREIKALLRRAIKAHGGREGGSLRVAAAGAVRLEYRLKGPDGATTTVRYLRVGEGVRVSLDPGADPEEVWLKSITNRGWHLTEEGWQVEDPEWVSILAARFSPETLLAIPLSVGPDLGSSQGWAQLTSAHLPSPGGPGLVVLKGEGGEVPSSAQVQSATFDLASGLLQEAVTWNGEERLAERFEGWMELADGLVIPSRIEWTTESGGTQLVEVTSFNLDELLPLAEVQDPPSPASGTP